MAKEIDWPEPAESGFDIVCGELAVIRADSADRHSYVPVQALLRRVRRAFGIDPVFIAEFVDGEHAVHADVHGVALCEGYGRSLLGEHGFSSVVVVGEDGLAYGALCCVVRDSVQLEALYSVGRLIADWLSHAELGLSDLMPLGRESVLASLPDALH